jgi:hypothetical protein
MIPLFTSRGRDSALNRCQWVGKVTPASIPASKHICTDLDTWFELIICCCHPDPMSRSKEPKVANQKDWDAFCAVRRNKDLDESFCGGKQSGMKHPFLECH